MDTYAITSLSISQEGSARLKSATKVPEGSRGMSTELQVNDKKVEIVCSTKAIEANFKGTELQNLKYPDLTKASRKDIKAYISRLEGAAQNLYSTAKNEKEPKAVAALKM